MAISCRRRCFKYAKCLIITVVAAFFTQLILAAYYFPLVSDSLLLKEGISRLNEESTKKYRSTQENEDDQSKQRNKPIAQLRIEELNFKPACEIISREAVSAINRAKTQGCKFEIVNKTCLIQNGQFYPEVLPSYCSKGNFTYGKHLGCFQDDKKVRLLSSFYGNYITTNTPKSCLDICVQGGFQLAGVQYGSECFCGDNHLPAYAKVSDSNCDIKCTGDNSQVCGGYFTMNIYETGLDAFVPIIPKTPLQEISNVRIVFLLTLNGRALRQIHRLINALYRNTHYFYIHVDARQDYLHRQLKVLERKFPNIKLAEERYSTIWGGASLLKMLLSSMKAFFKLDWEWDYVINLSESDFPIKSLQKLESFLSANKGLNFVKSHGREVQRFIKKQGIDKTFIECETHMWRVGDRKLPQGVTIDGGSDWIALSPKFVSYIIDNNDDLLKGLQIIFEHTLLPAESYFHTVLRNSQFCHAYVDNNLHVTNWKRKLGCKCQYKHVVDWCGCSPNDFRTEDWSRIQNTQDRQLFFARKFEPIINQEIITRVEQFIGYNDHFLLENLESYWQNLYNVADLTSRTDDVLLTHAGAITRQNAKILLGQECIISPEEVIEINSYNLADIYKGNLILHKAMASNKEVIIETWYKPRKYLELNFEHRYADGIKIFQVGSDYDQKEMMFRNLANVLGPLSEPILLYHLNLISHKQNESLTVMWLDPSGVIADVSSIHINESNLTNFMKPYLKLPLLPGIWKVGLFEESSLIASTKFLITPLEYFSGKELSLHEANIIHSGSQNAYKDFSSLKFLQLLPKTEEGILLQKLTSANIKRTQKDLRDWIDSLSVEFYKVLGSCLMYSQPDTEHTFSCGSHKFKNCYSTGWSSLSPDPKGNIGKLNKITGRLERV